MKQGEVRDLGCVSYHEAWGLQKELVRRRQLDEIPDTLLLCTHPPTYTLGKSGKSEHLLVADVKQIGAEFVSTDRGGDITFHGPGQLVIYPILKLKEFGLGVHSYLRNLEESTIQTLKSYGVCGHQEEGMTGVWVDGAKIAAIGVRLSRWVSMHGIAINVNTDLTYFQHIVPCGLAGKLVTSLQEILKKVINMEQFQTRWVFYFSKVFNLESHGILTTSNVEP